MKNWEDYKDTPTIDLIEYMKRKDSQEDKDIADAASTALFFRFRSQFIKGCEFVCSRHKHYDLNLDTAIKIAYISFSRFKKNPSFSKEKSNSQDIDTGLILYLNGIARKALSDFFNKRKEFKISPYTGEEEVIRLYPEINEDNIKVEDLRNYRLTQLVLDMFSRSHQIAFLTYHAYEVKGHNMPKPLLKKLRKELGLKQVSVRAYKHKVNSTINQVKKICQTVNKITKVPITSENG